MKLEIKKQDNTKAESIDLEKSIFASEINDV